MFATLITATLRILFFRAGPQDFPYDPRLTAPLVVTAAVANGLMFVQVLPIGAALVMALAMVGGLALATRGVLRTRQLEARFHQTFAALLATNAALTFLLVPFFAQVAPTLRELASNPELLEHPEQFKLPQGIGFVMNALNVWSFAVTAAIFRHAANVSTALGLLISLVIAVALLFFVAFAGSFAGLMFGGAA
ncbi:hypothetical protein [Solimonas terrae]|uniref:Yip1 domain-containing protein n=1 Tax=Solimonas terrae TaxID=1396819 RepID=A0A6M2BUN9_9GAMM|nr:hypothetical protein [Solimonas terrae]NGY05833.1 hypothetical protein [Solimonas terrae]